MFQTYQWWNLAALVCVARGRVVSPVGGVWLTGSDVQVAGFPAQWSPDMRGALDRMEEAGNIRATRLSNRAMLTEQGLAVLAASLPREQLGTLGEVEYVVEVPT